MKTKFNELGFPKVCPNCKSQIFDEITHWDWAIQTLRMDNRGNLIEIIDTEGDVNKVKYECAECGIELTKENKRK